jgi:hypothetical protein
VRERWGLEEVVVLALAANRLARAIAVDEITEPVRDRVDAWARRGSAGRERLAQLVHCPTCTGWWTSLALSLVVPGRRRLLRGVAVAGGQVMLSLAERLVSEQGRVAVYEAKAEEELLGVR